MQWFISKHKQVFHTIYTFRAGIKKKKNKTHIYYLIYYSIFMSGNYFFKYTLEKEFKIPYI